MPRFSIVQVTAVLLVALVGTMAIAAVQRVKQRRDGTATAATAAPATSAARTVDAPPLQRTLTIPDAQPVKPKPQPTFQVARVKPGYSVSLRSKPNGRS